MSPTSRSPTPFPASSERSHDAFLTLSRRAPPRHRAWRREVNERQAYDNAVDDFVRNISYHEKYARQAITTWKGVESALKSHTSNTAQVEFLKEQIKMRVYGCGWDE